MGITVRELAEMNALRTSIVAGFGGCNREIAWAHQTELPEPWTWLGSGDLLLTNGLNLPKEIDAQISYVNEISAAGMAGVVLGEGPHLTMLSTEALARADEINLPILVSEYSVPWVTLVRIVAESNAQQGHSRISRILRSYDVLRRSHGSDDARQSMLSKLGRECSCDLYVVDSRSVKPVISSEKPLGLSVETELRKLAQKHGCERPAFSRIFSEGTVAFVLPLGSTAHSMLVAEPYDVESQVDLLVLQYVATIMTLEVERIQAEVRRTRELGARLLDMLLEGTAEPEHTMHELIAIDLSNGPWRLLKWREKADDQGSIASFLEQENVPFLHTQAYGSHYGFVQDEKLAVLTEANNGVKATKLGVSQRIQRLSRVNDAAREASWALDSRFRTSMNWFVVYGKDTSPFLPKTIDEALESVEHVLGEVLRYDQKNEAQLVESLIAYLDSNRTWQQAADNLGVHRQTLVYRISRVEKISGRSLQNVEEQTELYLATKTLKILNDSPSVRLPAHFRRPGPASP